MEDKEIICYINGVPITEDDKGLSLEEIFDKVKREEDKYFFTNLSRRRPLGVEDGTYLVRNGKISRL